MKQNLKPVTKQFKKLFSYCLIINLFLAFIVFHAFGAVHIIYNDNEDNYGSGNPDNDMSICGSDSRNPIEFNIFVENIPQQNAYLAVFINDVDFDQGEYDEVFINGNSLGYAVGEDELNYSTLFVIPDLSWVQEGKNLVQIYVDQLYHTRWCATTQSGQLIIDEGSGTLPEQTRMYLNYITMLVIHNPLALHKAVHLI